MDFKVQWQRQPESERVKAMQCAAVVAGAMVFGSNVTHRVWKVDDVHHEPSMASVLAGCRKLMTHVCAHKPRKSP
jgi:hypothetical protein